MEGAAEGAICGVGSGTCVAGTITEAAVVLIAMVSVVFAEGKINTSEIAMIRKNSAQISIKVSFVTWIVIVRPDGLPDGCSLVFTGTSQSNE
jgi:hypothetical protein